SCRRASDAFGGMARRHRPRICRRRRCRQDERRCARALGALSGHRGGVQSRWRLALLSGLALDRQSLVAAPGPAHLPINGWMALKANIPPKERRGLVLVDPAYEDSADFLRLDEALAQSYRKWPGGLYLLWYPIKARDAADALARRLRRLNVPKILRCELS